MSVVFINYRRDDAAAWAGRLHEHLARFFSRSRLFMDVDGHIAVGSEYDRIIQTELEGCHALIALIGPTWLTVQREGRPRLAHENDWVRREIAHALARHVVVMPILVGGARLPAVHELPADIASLVDGRHAAKIDDARWDDDVATIIEALRREVGEPLGVQSDIDAAAAALRRLAELIRQSPELAQTVGRYREVLALNVRQLADLDFYKKIHDALHKIEDLGLNALRRSRNSKPQFLACRSFFRRAKQEIEQLLAQRTTISSGLADELQVSLDAAARALEGPTDGADLTQSVESTIAELSGLVGHLPTELDHEISAAAKALQEQGRLDELAHDLQQAAQDSTARMLDLAPLLGDLQRLETARREFARVVDEHSRLQRLDSLLRELCSNPRRAQWDKFKTLRAKLSRPLSAPVQSLWEALDAFEADVDSAFQEGRAAQALESLQGNFVSMFHDVDTNLKEMSRNLSAISGPLQQILLIRVQA